MSTILESSAIPFRQVLDPTGKVVDEDLMPKLTDDQLRKLMHRMVFTRHGPARYQIDPPRPTRLLRSGRGSGSVDDRQRIRHQERGLYPAWLP